MIDDFAHQGERPWARTDWALVPVPWLSAQVGEPKCKHA